MRKGFTLPELLTLILFLSLFGFCLYAAVKGSPNLRLFAGIALVAYYLPVTISGVIHARLTTAHAVIMSAGAMLIASKFIF